MTYRELIYIILDQIKATSDDSAITEDHALFLANKVRALILKQRYSDVKRQMPLSNYQTINVPLEFISQHKGEYLAEGTVEIPTIMTIGRVYVGKGLNTSITLVPFERFQYTASNRFVKYLKYATIDPRHKFYLKSYTSIANMDSVEISAIFENPIEAASLDGDNQDLWDKEYPLEESLVSTVMELVVKYLGGAIYQPADPINNADDDLANLQSFIRSNMKKNSLGDNSTTSSDE
jgi:hypothetical protein